MNVFLTGSKLKQLYSGDVQQRGKFPIKNADLLIKGSFYAGRGQKEVKLAVQINV